MNIGQTIKLTALPLAVAAFILGGCKKDDDGFSTNRDLQNKTTVEWRKDTPVGDTTIVAADISSGVAEAVADVGQDHPNVQITSLEVVSITFISQDLSSFNYLDDLDVYIAEANPSDILDVNPEPQGKFIGTVEPDSFDEANLTLEIVDSNVRQLLTSSDSYDIYLVSRVNENIQNFSSDRIAEVEVTLRMMLES